MCNCCKLCMLGTVRCGSDSINFTTLEISPSNNNSVHTCLQSDGSLDTGRLGQHQKYDIKNTKCYADILLLLKLWTTLT